MRYDPRQRCTWRETAAIAALALAATGSLGLPRAEGHAYSIYEIQHTTDLDGHSTLEGQVVDCLGGIVTHKFGGFRPKLTVQDPNRPSGWAAVQVKDWLHGAPLFHSVSIGDRVTLSNVYVEESRGNTTLQCFAENGAALAVISRDNEIPEPLAVSAAEIASPLGDDSGGWYVAAHEAEKYEHMRLRISRVVVGPVNLGKAADNYALRSWPDSKDAVATCWAADYMNADATGDYHPDVSTGEKFCHVEGILEQYTNLREGWDYYQLVTTSTADFLISQTADLDDDCDVDFLDFRVFAGSWLADCDVTSGICGGSDLNEDGAVRIEDLALLANFWLEGQLTPDGGDSDEQW